MQRWANIGVGIVCVVVLHKPGQEIVPRIGGDERTQLLTGRVDQVNDDRAKIGYGDEDRHPAETANIIKQRVDIYTQQIEEPEHIGNGKYLAEGDVFIKRDLDRIVGRSKAVLLQGVEEQHIDRPEQQKLQMRKFFRIEQMQTETTVIDNRFW